jgi:plastocyanin
MRGNRLLPLLVTCAVVAGLLFWMSTKSSIVEKSALPAVQSAELYIVHGVLKGPSEIDVAEGDTVNWRVTSDEPDELHLHGYDMHLSLQAGKTETLTFVASRTGRFPIELHRADVELAVLEVYPRHQ